MDKNKNTDIVKLDNTVDELFAKDEARKSQPLMSYVISFFTTASLPFKNIHKTVFKRKGANGLSLTLTSPVNVPFGRYGRLLLTVLTTHAVLSKEKNAPVYLEYNTLGDLLKEMRLPKQRGKDIREQLDCYSNASFAFSQEIRELKAGYLFKDMYDEGNYPTKDVEVTTRSTGNIRFTEGVQYKEINDGTGSNKIGSFKIILSAEFAGFCQAHAVPIDYNVYKEISSPSGKDLYTWLVYRNNGITEPVFIPRQKLVEQFMPVEKGSSEQESVYYNRLIDELKEIKEKYYPEVKFSIDKTGAGITLYKSPTPIIKDDKRYALITADL